MCTINGMTFRAPPCASFISCKQPMEASQKLF